LWVCIQFRRGVLDTTIRDKVCHWLAAGRWLSPGTPVSSNNKTDHHDITEVLLKVTLNTINPLTHKCIPNVRYLIFFTVYNSKAKIHHIRNLIYTDMGYTSRYYDYSRNASCALHNSFSFSLVLFFSHLIDNIKYVSLMSSKF
jgi:hypothetical protein